LERPTISLTKLRSHGLGTLAFWLADAVLFIFLFSGVLQAADGSLPASPHPFLIVGHMGAPFEAPENTIESFKKAIELGANAIETDICMTKDKYIVIWHDWAPNSQLALLRQLGRQGLKYRPFAPKLWEKARKPVIELTLAELRRNFGYTLRNAPGSGIHPAGTIPTLQEFCAWASGHDELERVFFDVKLPKERLDLLPPFFLRVRKILDTYDMTDKATLLIPRKEIAAEAVKQFGEGGPNYSFDQEIPTGMVINPKKFSAANAAIALRTQWASIGRPVLTFLGYPIFKKIVKSDLERIRLHNSGQPITPIEGYLVWTIDKPDEMKELMNMGVSGILTDRPDLLRQVFDGFKKH